MTKYNLLALTAALLLAGCATTSGPGGQAGVDNRDLSAQGRPGANAVIPSGPLSAIQPSELSPRTVAALEPPPDLWARIRRGFSMPDLDNDLVRQQEQWYASRPDYMQRMTDRSRKYLFHIVEELERRGMPTELALLPFIESAFNPQAVSSARAAGMWQFMPATGKVFDLKQNLFRDDRRSVLESTRAALDYLQKLYNMFGDWHLALAAYNWGEGNLSRAIARNQKMGLGTSYEDLNLPNETRNYVPKLQAVKNIIADPDRFHAELPVIENHPYFQSVALTRDMDVEVAAKLADVQLDDFRALNPQLKQPVILAAGTPQILLPWDNAAVFKRNVDEYTAGKFATWTAWTTPTTMTAAEAARRVGMTEIDLRSVNSIPPRMLIKAGSTLIVPRSSSTSQGDVASHVADNAQLSLAPEIVMRRITVKAARHDSVASVARRYHLAPATVAEWNHTHVGAAFRAGQKVVVEVPVRTHQRVHIVRTSAHTAPAHARAPAHATRKPAARRAAPKRKARR